MRIKKRSSCDSGSGNGAYLMGRVLSGNHKKRLGQRVGFSLHRNLMLFHRFQQRALRFGRGAINFIGQRHLVKYRAGMEFKLVVFNIKNRSADDVGRQNIAGELNPLIR